MKEVETATVVDIETLTRSANSGRRKAVRRLIGAWSSIDNRKVNAFKKEFRGWFNTWKT